MPLISIIVPCYNVEYYIDRCMHSIVDQTIKLENLEIILVNDASTDHTYSRLLYWEEQYPDNIIVISYEENMRQGYARNVGLNYATADYIGFVDSDDWIAPDMYETLYRECVSEDNDAVFGKYIRTENPENENRSNNTYVPQNGGVYTGIYKKSVILDNNVFFPAKLTYEDNFWGDLLKPYLKKVKYIDKVIYYYCINQNSTILAKNQDHHLDRLKIEPMLIQEYMNRGLFETYKSDLLKNFIKRYYLNTLYILFTRQDTAPNIFRELKTTVNVLFPDWDSEFPFDECTYLEKNLLFALEKCDNFTEEEWHSFQYHYLKAYVGIREFNKFLKSKSL